MVRYSSHFLFIHPQELLRRPLYNAKDRLNALNSLFEGVTNKEAARQIGVSESTLTMIRRGEHLPSMRTASRIARTVGVSMDYLAEVLGLGHETDFLEAYPPPPYMVPSTFKAPPVRPRKRKVRKPFYGLTEAGKPRKRRRRRKFVRVKRPRWVGHIPYDPVL